MTGVSIVSPSPAPVGDDINDIRLALRGGNEFAARAQALESKKAEIEAATSRYETAKKQHDEALARLNIGNDVATALANARKAEAAMTSAYDMATKVLKASEARADATITAAAAEIAAEKQSAQADRARAADTLAAANAKEQAAQAKCDAADQRGQEADRERLALQGKIDRVDAVLSQFVADLDGAVRE